MSDPIDREDLKPYHLVNLQTIGFHCNVGDFIQSKAWMSGLSAKVVAITDEGVKLHGDFFNYPDEDGCIMFYYTDQKPEWKNWCLVSSLKEFKFEIPSTCREVVTVEANSLEEAVQKVVDGETKDSSIPESEYAIEMDVESVLSCHV